MKITLILFFLFTFNSYARSSGCWSDENSIAIDGIFIIVPEEQSRISTLVVDISKHLKITGLLEELDIAIGEAQRLECETREEMKRRVDAGLIELIKKYKGLTINCDGHVGPFPSFSGRN